MRTRLRTAVGIVEITGVDQVPATALRADDARRAGATSLAALREALAARADRPIFRVELGYGGTDTRETLRKAMPSPSEIAALVAALDRLDASSTIGPWTRATLRLIDANPELDARMGELVMRLVDALRSRPKSARVRR